MKLTLFVATFAFGVLLLALGGWLVQGLRSPPRLWYRNLDNLLTSTDDEPGPY